MNQMKTYIVYRDIIFLQAITIKATSYSDALKRAKQHPVTDFTLKVTKHRGPWRMNVVKTDSDKSYLEAQASEAMKVESKEGVQYVDHQNDTVRSGSVADREMA